MINISTISTFNNWWWLLMIIIPIIFGIIAYRLGRYHYYQEEETIMLTLASAFLTAFVLLYFSCTAHDYSIQISNDNKVLSTYRAKNFQLNRFGNPHQYDFTDEKTGRTLSIYSPKDNQFILVDQTSKMKFNLNPGSDYAVPQPIFLFISSDGVNNLEISTLQEDSYYIPAQSKIMSIQPVNSKPGQPNQDISKELERIFGGQK
ncbi:MAG: hypothetical protein FWE43_03685 [Streptococcaceae bacterium]|nr:hypothetical protein [Streptococcaceae bacterium]